MTVHKTFDPDKHCGRTNRQGNPCTLPLGWGTGHAGVGACKQHGGASPGAERNGRLQLEDRRLRAEVARLGLPVDGDPAGLLLDEVRRTAGMVALLEAEIAGRGVPLTDLTRGTKYVRRKESVDGVETTSEAGPGLDMMVQWWHKEREHLVKACSVALSAGIAQRQVELAEQEAETLGALVVAALDAAGVAGPARVTALHAARDRFALIAGGAG